MQKGKKKKKKSQYYFRHVNEKTCSKFFFPQNWRKHVLIMPWFPTDMLCLFLFSARYKFLSKGNMSFQNEITKYLLFVSWNKMFKFFQLKLFTDPERSFPIFLRDNQGSDCFSIPSCHLPSAILKNLSCDKLMALNIPNIFTEQP